MRRLVFVLMWLMAVVAAPASARELTIATWNMGWLTERMPGTADVPDNVMAREDADYARLRRYAERLGADVVAFQEVDGEGAAARVFDPAVYALHLTTETDIQRPGFAVRRTLSFTRHPDVVELDRLDGKPRTLRRGADITVHFPEGDLRLLAVHLKSGCFDRPLEDERQTCRLLRGQVPVLAAWLAAREREGVAYAIIGDFNRRLDTKDDVWRALTRSASGLRLATDGITSTCWGGEYPRLIDHVILGGPARDWLIPGSPSELVYDEREKAFKRRISDHCPVSVRIAPR